MDYTIGGSRSTRRARHKPIQSCEIVGILPAEETNLRRALYASLIQEKKDTGASVLPLDKIKTEIGTDLEEIDVTACNRLSSPELCEQNCLSKNNMGQVSLACSGSCPSSPQSFRSNTSLHLCLSSSSLPMSESSISSCDSLFLPWSSGSDDKLSTKRARKGKDKKGLSKKLKPKMIEFEKGLELNSDGVKLENNRQQKPKGRGKMQTARKSASKSHTSHDSSKDAPYQAQRKFAANHAPPARLSLGEVKPVTGLKKPPKTEDFITYLCLRGSSCIPDNLKQFESPWTPLRKRNKTTKSKKT